VLPDATGSYTHGTLVTGARRTVFVSGQVPWADEDGEIPEDFESQCRMTWRNVLAVLVEAGMGVRNLAKVTIYLSDRRYRETSGRVRQEVLGDRTARPATRAPVRRVGWPARGSPWSAARRTRPADRW
jgi:2-iminobutanoate/2-iminopropanoate deaminase